MSLRVIKMITGFLLLVYCRHRWIFQNPPSKTTFLITFFEAEFVYISIAVYRLNPSIMDDKWVLGNLLNGKDLKTWPDPRPFSSTSFKYTSHPKNLIPIPNLWFRSTKKLLETIVLFVERRGFMFVTYICLGFLPDGRRALKFDVLPGWVKN